jgi:drug/metabolite transporter (DMT)-like permease
LDIFIIIGIGICGVFAQFTYVKALKVAEASFVSPFEFTRLIFAIPVGVFLFKETFYISTFLGGLLIVLAGWALIKIENEKNRKLAQITSLA